MTDTSGLTSMKPFAHYDHATSSWKTYQGTDEKDSELLSGSWPKNGIVCDGRAYELETSVPPITENVSSSWRVFDTPDTMPEAPNSGSNRKSQPAGLLNQVLTLLPTPTARDCKELTITSRTREGKEQYDTIGRAVGSPDFKEYQPAIDRWASIRGVEAPTPAFPHPKLEGRYQLNPVFVEWMMGLELGRVTDVTGVARTQQLKILGNGVVPQQAAAALRILLEVE